MTSNKPLIVSLALAALCSGCASSGPSTQRGAVGGALLGAAAGGIIGNNHGSHNTWSGAAIGAGAGALAGAAIGNAADQERGTTYGNPPPSSYDTAPRQPVYTTPAPVYTAPPQTQYQAPAQYEQPTEYVVMQQPPAYPPPPREVVTVRPAREAVWVQGYWSYAGRGGPYQWVPGHWEIPPGRYRTFVQPRWERQSQGYVYVRGYWH